MPVAGTVVDRKEIIRVQEPDVGGPGATVVLAMLTNVSARCTPGPETVLANVATGPAVPTNPPDAMVEVMEEPRVSDPGPAGAFSMGAAGRFAALSTQPDDPAGSLSW